MLPVTQVYKGRRSRDSSSNRHGGLGSSSKGASKCQDVQLLGAGGGHTLPRNTRDMTSSSASGGVGGSNVDSSTKPHHANAKKLSSGSGISVISGSSSSGGGNVSGNISSTVSNTREGESIATSQDGGKKSNASEPSFDDPGNFLPPIL